MTQISAIVGDKLDTASRRLLEAIHNPSLHAFLEDAVRLTEPKKIRVFGDSPEDLADIRQMALNGGGEHPLKTPGHTYHFDGPND